MKPYQSIIPLREMEAPGWETSRLSLWSFALLVVISMSLLFLIALITVSETLFKGNRLSGSPSKPHLRLSYRTNRRVIK